MKSIHLLLGVVLGCLATVGFAKEKILLSGSYSPTIMIIDKETKSVEWVHNILGFGGKINECNSVDLDNDGNIFYTYKRGVKLINRNGVTLWEYKLPQESADEVQSAIATDTGYMIGICANPAKFLFFDKAGKITKTLTYDLKSPKVHDQFRRLNLSEQGHIIITLIGQRKVLIIDQSGNKVNLFNTFPLPFSASEVRDGVLLVSGKDDIREYDMKTGKELKTIIHQKLGDVTASFLCQSVRLKNGNILVANWQGHKKHADRTDPQLFEIDPIGKVVWTFMRPDLIPCVSAFLPFTEE